MWRAPKFWRQRNLVSRSLLPFSALYGGMVRYRLRRPAQKADVGVICVGNITVGGAGKTPSALFLARLLQDMDERSFILTRGFGRRATGLCRVDVAQHDARQVGDEALMLAAYVPVIVGKDRVAAARLAIAQGATILVMDDGFQNPFLHKNLSFLVVDGDYGLGNGYMLPAGPLRERPKDALSRADAVIMIGGDQVAGLNHSLPIFHGRIKAQEKLLFSKPVIAFAGIGRPEKFFALLRDMGANLVEHYSFSDHHVFRQKDAAFLLNRADFLNAQLITTEKDMARLSARTGQCGQLAQICQKLRVKLVFNDKDVEQIKVLLKEALKKDEEKTN